MKNEDIYGISKWGYTFFEILQNGNLGLKNPTQKENKAVDLISIIKKLNKNSSPPYLIRISNYIEYMIYEINTCFQLSIKQIGYENQYKGVFPIKAE